MEGEVIGFLNIYDRGYHQLMPAKKNGQRTLVRDSGILVAESGESLLRAASVAVSRSGNERAVNRAKISNFVSNLMEEKKSGK